MDTKLVKQLCCSDCNDTLTVPKLLPCGYSICEKCELRATMENEFNCKQCGEMHEVAAQGLPLNLFAKRLLETEPNEFEKNLMLEANFEDLEYSGKKYKLLTTLNQLKSSINEENLKNLFAEGIIKIDDHCNHLIEEIDVTTESCKAKIDQCRENLLENVDKFKNDCLNELNNKPDNDQFKQITAKCRDTIEDLLIKACDAGNERIDLELLSENVKKIEIEYKRLKKMINEHLENERIIFRDSRTELTELLIGKLEKGPSNPFEFIELLRHVGRNKIEYYETYGRIVSALVDINDRGEIVLLTKTACYSADDGIKTEKCCLRYYFEENNKFKHKFIDIKTRNKYQFIRLVSKCAYVSYEDLKEHQILNAKLLNYEYRSEIVYGIDVYDLEQKTSIKLSSKKNSIKLNFMPTRIDVSNNKIYLVSKKAPFVHVFDDKLQKLCAFGDELSQPYYIPKDFEMLCVKNEFILYIKEKKVNVLSETTGKLLHQFGLKGNSHYCFDIFHKQTLIAEFARGDFLLPKKCFIHSINGDLCGQLSLNHIKNISDVRITDNGYFLVHDFQNHCLYIN